MLFVIFMFGKGGGSFHCQFDYILFIIFIQMYYIYCQFDDIDYLFLFN